MRINKIVRTTNQNNTHQSEMRWPLGFKDLNSSSLAISVLTIDLPHWKLTGFVSVPREWPQMQVFTNPSMLLRFSLRLARALFHAHYFYYFHFFKLDLSDFLNVHLLEYATD
jgi:hypothetical protein